MRIEDALFSFFLPLIQNEKLLLFSFRVSGHYENFKKSQICENRNMEELVESWHIENLLARYAHAGDEYDAEAWVGCFSNKGIFEVHTGNVRMQFIGEKALSKFINAHIRLLPGTRHVQTNHITTVDKLRAKNHCTLVGFLSRPEKIYTFIAGSYETDLEKIGGEWKITHRIVHVDNGASFVEGDIAEQTQSFMEWMATNSEVMQGE